MGQPKSEQMPSNPLGRAGFPFWMAWGTVLRGGALAEQGRREEGIAQMREGIAAYRATGAGQAKTWFLALLAEAYEKEGQTEEGLTLLAEALALVDKTEERYYGVHIKVLVVMRRAGLAHPNRLSRSVRETHSVA